MPADGRTGLRHAAVMQRIPFSIAVCFALAAGYADGAAADSYRCGRLLVKDGDSAARLLRLCGEPRRRDSGVENVMIGGAFGPQRVQRWYYRKNRRSLEYVVMVHRGRVVAIDSTRR